METESEHVGERIVDCMARLAAQVHLADVEAVRSDELAWSALALARSDAHPGAARAACLHLSKRQTESGRVPVYPDLDQAGWPTALAILAWHATGGFEDNTDRAVRSLLESKGEVVERDQEEPGAHDSTIPGWAWIDATHSWVEPTAVAVLALRARGLGGHARTADGVRLLLDRQLPRGGWNYGNTVVFGTELLPSTETTGAALAALAGVAEETRVARSLSLLESELPSVRTPLSLSWALFALAAWKRPSAVGARQAVADCLALEESMGGYDGALRGMLATVASSGADLLSLLGISGQAETGSAGRR